MRVRAGPPWQWWLCDTVWGHRFIEKHKKLLLETSQHSNSSTCCVGDFYNLPVPPFCFNMSISIYTLLLPKFEFYQSTFDIIQQLGSYLQTISLASCLGTWQRQQWVGLRHPSSYTHVTPAAWRRHGKLMTLFTQSKSYVESIFGVRHSPREADVQPNTPNSPEQMRSDAAWALISACLLAGEDTRFPPEANMNISFSMFNGNGTKPGKRRGFVTPVPIDFSQQRSPFSWSG